MLLMPAALIQSPEFFRDATAVLSPSRDKESTKSLRSFVLQVEGLADPDFSGLIDPKHPTFSQDDLPRMLAMCGMGVLLLGSDVVDHQIMHEAPELLTAFETARPKAIETLRYLGRYFEALQDHDRVAKLPYAKRVKHALAKAKKNHRDGIKPVRLSIASIAKLAE